MSNVGLVVVLASDVGKRELNARLTTARSLVPAGRQIVVLWDNNRVDFAVDAHAVRRFMGSTGRTRGNPTTLFFTGSGCVRVYRSHEMTRPCRVLRWNMFRNPGPKAYMRRRGADAHLLAASRINVESPVFTRDVANNVWNLIEHECEKRVISRFQGLLTWHDEETVVIGTEIQVSSRLPASYDADLVARVVKARYEGFKDRMFAA